MTLQELMHTLSLLAESLPDGEDPRVVFKYDEHTLCEVDIASLTVQSNGHSAVELFEGNG